MTDHTDKPPEPQQLPTGIEVGEFCQDCRKPLTECTCEPQQELPPLPPTWITNRYGLALMMIREGCADPRRVAADALDVNGEPPEPQQGLECEHGLDRRLPCGDCQKEYEYQQQGKIAPCPVHELLLKRNFPYHAGLAAECPLRRQPDLDKLASELESMAATLHEPPCECALCAQVHGIATYIRNWKGGGE